MFWIMLPFGIILILITAMLLTDSMVGKLTRLSKSSRTVKNWREESDAIVSHSG
jgi:hypothetical protein